MPYVATSKNPSKSLDADTETNDLQDLTSSSMFKDTSLVQCS